MDTYLTTIAAAATTTTKINEMGLKINSSIPLTTTLNNINNSDLNIVTNNNDNDINTCKKCNSNQTVFKRKCICDLNCEQQFNTLKENNFSKHFKETFQNSTNHNNRHINIVNNYHNINKSTWYLPKTADTITVLLYLASNAKVTESNIIASAAATPIPQPPPPLTALSLKKECNVQQDKNRMPVK